MSKKSGRTLKNIYDYLCRTYGTYYIELDYFGMETQAGVYEM